MMTYLSIGFRTFAQLATAVIAGAQVYDWTNGDKGVGFALVGFGLLAALIGALVAMLWAYVSSPATTALEKALRSAAQAVAATLGGLAINSGADLVATKALLVSGAIAVVLAFALTFLQYQSPTPAPPA
jgi:predicted MFS family arabinose efflux permease